MDEDGYYHASFGGVSGLVPANFVQESEVTDFSTRERLFNQVSRLVAVYLTESTENVNCLLFQSLTHNLSTASYSSSPTVQSQHQYSPTTQPRCYLPKGKQLTICMLTLTFVYSSQWPLQTWTASLHNLLSLSMSRGQARTASWLPGNHLQWTVCVGAMVA